MNFQAISGQTSASLVWYLNCQRRSLMGQRSYFGDGILVLFLLVQLFDGACTYLGIQRFGFTVERNPIIVWHILTIGPLAGLVFVKSFAVVCAGFLHLRGRHRTVAVLTILYLVVAVRPWTNLLLSGSL